MAIALTTLIQYDEIAEIKFERVSKAVSGSFDLVVTKKSGDVVQLTSIRREEFDRMCAADRPTRGRASTVQHDALTAQRATTAQRSCRRAPVRYSATQQCIDRTIAKELS